MSENKKNIRILCFFIFLVVSILAIWFLGKLFMPKYASGVLEGGMTEEYYAENCYHDVIFVGDCEVYENFSPITLWEDYGITSYIRGSAQQLIWQSYYFLEECFKTDTPEVVVYNVQAMKYSEPQSEAYNRMALDGMKFSPIKLDAIRASMTEDEELLDYLVPFLRYHSRWSELGQEDWDYMFSHRPVTVAGYLMRADTKPMTKLPTAPILDDYTIGERCFEYLAKMQELCEKNGAKLVLIKSPSIWPYWYEEWDRQISGFASAHGLDYINLLDVSEEIGIDMQTDSYDAGMHLNIYGAEKLSRYFGEILRTRYNVTDRRDNEEIAEDWAIKRSDYYALYAAQVRELEEFGYLKSWTLGEGEKE